MECISTSLKLEKVTVLRIRNSGGDGIVFDVENLFYIVVVVTVHCLRLNVDVLRNLRKPTVFLSWIGARWRLNHSKDMKIIV